MGKNRNYSITKNRMNHRQSATMNSIQYFLNITDTASILFKSRFESYANRQNMFGFLYMNQIRNLDNEYLLKRCQHLNLRLKGAFNGIEMF